MTSSCNNCHYSIFFCLDRYCAHPGHPYQIKNVNRKCADWVDFEEKGERLPKQRPQSHDS
jgi:hypothetical protein